MKHSDWLHKQLQNDEFAALYLSEAAQDLEPQVFTAALRHVVDARSGLAQLAEQENLSRQNLYKSLSPKGNPTARTMFASLRATGLQLMVCAAPTKVKAVERKRATTVAD